MFPVPRSPIPLKADQDAHLITPVRKERLPKSKKLLAEEAAKVLHQVDGVACVANTDYGKFHFNLIV